MFIPKKVLYIHHSFCTLFMFDTSSFLEKKYIYIYIYLYIYVAVQGLLRKARNIKRDMSRKRGYQPKKKLYLYVVAVIMTKFRGYQFNTPPPTHPIIWVSPLPTPTQICLLHNFSDHNVYCLHKVRVSMFKLFIFEIVNIKQASVSTNAFSRRSNISEYFCTKAILN